MKICIIKSVWILLLCTVVVSCNTDLDDQASILGTWIETAPVPDRTTLIFENESRVTRIDGEGNAETFRYRIEDRTLYLAIPGEGGTSELFFEQVNTNKLKVGNLYPSIPEAEPVFIILERY